MLARRCWDCSQAVNMLSLGDAIINIVQAVCYTNELAAGTKFMWYTLLMMLARFGAAKVLTDQQSA
jgi:hypothetical protein